MKKMRLMIPAGLVSLLAIIAISCEKNKLLPDYGAFSDIDIELAKVTVVHRKRQVRNAGATRRFAG